MIFYKHLGNLELVDVLDIIICTFKLALYSAKHVKFHIHRYHVALFLLCMIQGAGSKEIADKTFQYDSYSEQKCEYAVSTSQEMIKIFEKLNIHTVEIIKIIRDVHSSIGQDWYDQSANCKISLRKINNTIQVTKVEVRALGNSVILNYDIKTDKKITLTSREIAMLVFWGVVTKNFDTTIKRVNYLPNGLKKTILNFYLKSNLKSSPGARFRVLYKPNTYEIVAMSFGRKKLAVSFESSKYGAKIFDVEGVMLNSKTKRLALPVARARISSQFGTRMHPIFKVRKFHAGIDYAIRSGTPIKASADGVVIYVGHRGGYGNAVIIQHTDNMQTLYGHMRGFGRIRIGSIVKAGDVIGYVGSTGLSTGPHVHFEVRVNGNPVNPNNFTYADVGKLRGQELVRFREHIRKLRLA